MKQKVFTAKTEWNDGIKAPYLKGNIVETLQIGTDELKIYSPYSQK